MSKTHVPPHDHTGPYQGGTLRGAAITGAGGISSGGTSGGGSSVDAHLTDTTDAHDASAISFTPAAGIAATDVQAAVVEDAGDLAAHLADTAGAHAASAIAFTPNGSIAATDVQAAIQEVRDEAAGFANPMTTKGDLIVGDTGGSPIRKAVGTDTHVLTADSTAAGGIKWAAAGSGAVATDTIWDAKGDLAAGTGADTASRLAVGANDTVLMADSGQATGLKWVASQTPSTQAFGDAAAEGTADTYARGDHKHAMPADPGGSGALGRQEFVYPPLTSFVTAPTNSEDLAINGGTLAVPIHIVAPLVFDRLSIHNRNTASARSAEYRLYYYGGSTLDFVTGTDGTFSFTPTVASDRTSTPSSSITLQPGVYWLAIRNTSATQNFSIGYVNPAGTFFNAFTLSYTQTLGSALGATLTATGWSAGTRSHAVRIYRNVAFGI